MLVALSVLTQGPVPKFNTEKALVSSIGRAWAWRDPSLWFQGENMNFQSFARKIHTQFHKRVLKSSLKRFKKLYFESSIYASV